MRYEYDIVTGTLVELPDLPEEVITPIIPDRVTMRQARLALLAAGKLQAVDEAIDSLPEPQKTAAKIEWEYSQEIQRDKEFVQMLAPVIGLDEAGLDALFIAASQIE